MGSKGWESRGYGVGGGSRGGRGQAVVGSRGGGVKGWWSLWGLGW